MIKSEYIALLFYVLASTTGVVIIKKFFDTIEFKTLQDFFIQLFNIQLIVGVLLYIIGFLTWLYVLSRMDLNTAYPVAVTLSLIAIILTSSLILKEHITFNVGIGTILCLIGVFVILR